MRVIATMTVLTAMLAVVAPGYAQCPSSIEISQGGGGYLDFPRKSGRLVKTLF